MVLQFFPRLLHTVFLQLGEGPPQGTRGGCGKKMNCYMFVVLFFEWNFLKNMNFLIPVFLTGIMVYRLVNTTLCVAYMVT